MNHLCDGINDRGDLVLIQDQEHSVVVQDVLRRSHLRGVVLSVETILWPRGWSIDWGNVGVVHLSVQDSCWQVEVVVLKRRRSDCNGAKEGVIAMGQRKKGEM